MSACYSPADLARIARGESDDPGHLAECSVCSGRVAFLRGCLASGAEPIEAEAHKVGVLLAELERAAGTPLRWWRVVQEPRFHQPSLARRLVNLALAASRKNTQIALGYSAAATQIVEKLIAYDGDIANLRFDAWRHHAWLLREIGKYEECRAAFATAEAAAAQATDPELARALVLLSQAFLEMEPDLWFPGKAQTLLEQAEEVFARRDPSRLLLTVTTRGLLYSRSGDYQSAAAIFDEVVALTPPDDEPARADAMRNFLWATVLTGHSDEQVRAQIAALETIDLRRGATLSVLRDRWIRGLMSLNTAPSDEAVTLLRDAMRGFETKGDLDTAIRVGIDAVRALLSSQRYGECIELARDLASRSFGLDMREPSRRRALAAEAMAYLRDAAQLGALTGDLAESVATYIDKIRSQRAIDFIPPLPLHPM